MKTIKLAVLPSVYKTEVELKAYSKSSDKLPATPEKLFGIVHAQMASGTCMFIYRKKDGTLCKAIGTLKGDLIPPAENRGQVAVLSETKQNYWDITDQAFKAFSKNAIVAVLIF